MSSILKATTIVLIFIILAACGPDQPAAITTQEPGGEATEAPVEDATEAPVEEATEAPVTAGATVSVSQDTNCRTGPGSNFDLVIILKAGESAEIVGKDASGQYWVVSTSAGECWLWNENAIVSGDTSAVTARTSPATPTAVPPPDWNGTWHVWMWWSPGGTLIVEADPVFTQNGKNFSSSFTVMSVSFAFTGIVSDDGMIVSGSFNANGVGPYPFSFRRNPNDLRQFSGIFNFSGAPGQDGDFCGSKSGAPKPEPCRY